jgi:hypothetical protein
MTTEMAFSEKVGKINNFKSFGSKYLPKGQNRITKIG